MNKWILCELIVDHTCRFEFQLVYSTVQVLSNIVQIINHANIQYCNFLKVKTSIGSKKVGSVICLEVNPFATMTETDPLTKFTTDREKTRNLCETSDHQVKLFVLGI